MDERKAFEAWYSQSISESPGMLMKHPNGEYVYLTNEWLAWQAATAAERERAAKVCEETDTAHDIAQVWIEVAATRIRNYPNQDKAG